FVAATFLYLGYTVTQVHQPLMGYAMFESWHDIQYLAIVWLFNINRSKHPEAGRLIRFLFRPRIVLLAAYVIVCLIFGSLAHAWRLFDNPTAARIGFAMVTATALFHYYLDGFIWKIRDKDTRQALGVQQQADSMVPRQWLPAWSGHALLWSLFIVPAALLFGMESNASTRPLQVFERLVETFPSSAQAHYELGRTLQEQGRLAEAKVHFERALHIDSRLLPAHTLLGALLSSQNDLEEAKVHLEQVLKVDPKNPEAHNNLGIVFNKGNDVRRAQEEFELALKYAPDYALASNNLG